MNWLKGERELVQMLFLRSEWDCEAQTWGPGPSKRGGVRRKEWWCDLVGRGGERGRLYSVWFRIKHERGTFINCGGREVGYGRVEELWTEKEKL